MASKGRPRKATHLKVVAGTARKHRLNEDEPDGTAGRPQPPHWLSERGAELFHETVGMLESLGFLATEWQHVIADYASCLEEVEINTVIIEDSGRTYRTETQTGDVMHRPRPEVAMRSDAMKRAQALRSELGLGPASKSRVSASKKNEENPFDQFKAPKAR